MSIIKILFVTLLVVALTACDFGSTLSSGSGETSQPTISVTATEGSTVNIDADITETNASDQATVSVDESQNELANPAIPISGGVDAGGIDLATDPCEGLSADTCAARAGEG